jgi:tight adherence protein B
VGGVSSLSVAPLVLAGSIALAMWLVTLEFTSARTQRSERRARALAKIRGETERPRTEPAKRRRTPRIALRRPTADRLMGLGTLLQRAGLDMNAREFLIVDGILGAVGALAVGASFGPLAGAGGALGGLVLPIWWLRRRAGSRRMQINGQLNELLQVVAGGLTAGQSFLQSLEHSAREIDDPLRRELRITLNEIELGASIEEALSRLGERVQDDDLAMVIDAVLIQRRVGGNLSEILSNIAGTVRERIRMRGEVKALTGQARLSGWVLGLLPVAMAGILLLVSRDYMLVLFQTSTGHMLIAGGLGSELIGMLFLRKIANVSV